MISHSRLSPGVELHEIDRSNYEKVDYSITGTTILACGFADRGENYTPQWINAMTTFEQLYGKPTNEIERYFHAAAQEIINKGGICIASKLPYDNKSKDCFIKTEFSVNANLVSDSNDEYIKDLLAVDPSLTSFIEISSATDSYLAGDPDKGSRIDLDTLDKYRTNTANVDRGKIIIVDITRGDYGKINIIDRIENVTSCDVECLGIMPVLVSPLNAMFYQKIISSETEYNDDLEYTPRLSAYQPVSDAVSRKGLRFSRVDSQNFVMDLSSAVLNGECVSKIAVDNFPNIAFNLSSTLDRAYLKSVGVTVFKVVMDPSNDNKINFVPVESFIGQLDKNAKNKETGASDYIGNIINSKSQYINFFSNVTIDNRYKTASTLFIRSQCAGVMGFTEDERVKHIDYVRSIVSPLNVIFDKACDPNQLRLDVVVDAGVSNIAAFAARTQEKDKSTNPMSDVFNAESYPFLPAGSEGQIGWDFMDARGYVSKWYAVLKKFDDFCKSTRRDCMFVADVFRPVVLEGNEKVVRGTNVRNTIENTIVPRFKYIAGVNSSWSAGYSDWFYVQDGQTGDFFWCPPSIKAAGIYVYTDAYFHPWDAPAGFARGVVSDAYDIAFSPRNDEAGRIYQQAWNYAVSYPVGGIVMEGQKTFQLNRTALDRINVRRLMIWLEKRVTAVARRFIYEGNTSFMRQRFVDMIRPIFEEAKNGSGILDYAVRCDDTLNTPEVIDNNELRCICAVKPVKTIEWIRLNFIITSQSASVSEEVMR